MKFPPDLIDRVRSALSRMGYCFLSSDEIQRLLAKAPANRPARHKALQEFAQICEAEVETNEHLRSARFTPATVKAATAPSLSQPRQQQESDWWLRPVMA
jgi:hypothetical protein